MSDQHSYRARYQLHDPPISLAADECALVDIDITNVGELPWPHRGERRLALSYRWLDALGRLLPGEGPHAPLPRAVAPGEVVRLEVRIEPPERPGEHVLQVELVEEGVAWLSERGDEPLRLPVHVLPGDDRPRVCLVNGACRLHDAVSNHALEQLRFFHERGYRVLLLVGDIDERLPRELRRHICLVAPDALQDDTPPLAVRRAVTHFHGAELLIFHYASYYPLAEAIRLVGAGATILDYHGVTPPALWSGAQGADELDAGARLAALARFADHAHAHSAFARDELAATARIPADTISVFPYAVPLEAFRPGARDAALVARYGLEEGPGLLYVGRMAGNKRVVDLVRALPIVRARFPHARLLLVGDDKTPPYPQLVAEARREAEALGVGDAVIFTGQLPLDELVALYQTCDLFVTASRHEGFCIPVIEALACGTPVVGANATALPETIGPGGLTFPPGDHQALAEAVVALLIGR
jgi:glycosyltransferase involved in cell wall biosynthesis